MTELIPEDRRFLERFKAWKHRPKDRRPGSETDPTPQQVYDDLMKATFAPALRGVGLKGSGGRFELPSDTYWALLGFQKDVWWQLNRGEDPRPVAEAVISTLLDDHRHERPSPIYGGDTS